MIHIRPHCQTHSTGKTSTTILITACILFLASETEGQVLFPPTFKKKNLRKNYFFVIDLQPTVN